jgi:hypothetical protein
MSQTTIPPSYAGVKIRRTRDRPTTMTGPAIRHRGPCGPRRRCHRADCRARFGACPTVELGTDASNAAEAVARGRIRRGERHPAARLTEADVVSIRAKRRADGSLHRELADEYGVARTTISAAVRGVTWRHLEQAAA